ncbi:MAG: hypothetical protein EB125_04210 [Betaproteobacteria bacterium]|nr:hypothetical protein [Betaproteobacteria bacterium]
MCIVSAISVTSVNVPTAASMSAQVSARPAKLAGDNLPQPAGQNKNARELKQADKPDMLAQLKAIEAQIAARAEQAANLNALDISYNKKEAALSVKVQEQQTGELIRELKFKDYKAMAYTSHGYKGTLLDITA